MKNALVNIFDLVPGTDSHKATLESEGFSIQLRLAKNDDGNFRAHFAIPFNVIQKKIVMKLGDNEFIVQPEVDEGNNEFDESLQFFSLKVFDYIDFFMQKPDLKSEYAQKIKTEIKEIDTKLTEIYQNVFPQKIEKEKKAEMM